MTHSKYRRKMSISVSARRVCMVILLVLISCLGSRTAKAQKPPSVPTARTVPAIQSPVEDKMIFTHILFDQLEGRTTGPDSQFRWDGQAWTGTDMNRLWLKSEGFAGNGKVSDGDVEALYDRPIPHMRYFDAQAGVREDLDSGPRRTWGAVGVEGLLPDFYEFEPTFYFRDGGNVAGRVTALYNLLITNRLVAQPEVEVNFYNKDDPARGLGSGLSNLDTGVRLRYEFIRKFAPYVGFAYSRNFGNTAVFSRQKGEAVSDPSFVFGVRVWY